MSSEGATARHAAYAILIALAVGNMAGRILAVNSVNFSRLEQYRIDQRMAEFRDSLPEHLTDEDRQDKLTRKRAEVSKKLRLQRPFLSANDRSRWMAARALAEQGTFVIDEYQSDRYWASIDIVRHRGADGEMHFYSSKPPLTYLHMAAAYWLLNRTTGLNLEDDTYAVVRILLIALNVVPMVVLFALLAAVIERLGTTDFGRILAMATICMGTFLSTFAVVANNHICAAVAAGVALWALVEIRQRTTPSPWLYGLAGLAAALTAAFELPALAFLAFVGFALLIRAPKPMLLYFAPLALLVLGAYVGVNKYAHDSIRPPYMHREGEPNSETNWYHYTYVDANGRERQSYWMNTTGVDRGEARQANYALHSLVGHHGVFSLTPVWVLSMFGGLVWLGRGEGVRRELAAIVLALTVICLAFYINRPVNDRNYGGLTSGFRWMFWFAPLWTITMLPAADRLDCCRGGRAFALALLSWGVMSASFPTWNPWTHPWIWNWLEWLGVK